MSDQHSSDYPELPYGQTRCECGGRVYSNEHDGRCASCAQPEPVEREAALLRYWAQQYRQVIELNREEGASEALLASLLAKAAEWEREADALERRVA
jgi:hypothetical protein